MRAVLILCSICRVPPPLPPPSLFIFNDNCQYVLTSFYGFVIFLWYQLLQAKFVIKNLQNASQFASILGFLSTIDRDGPICSRAWQSSREPKTFRLPLLYGLHISGRIPLPFHPFSFPLGGGNLKTTVFINK